MPIRTLTAKEDLLRYDAWIRAHRQGTLWQSLAWKNFQDALHRETRVYVSEENGTIAASALVTIDRTAFNWGVWEMMRGPVWIANSGERAANSMMEKIGHDAKRDKCLSIFFSPVTEFTTDRSPLIAHRSRRHLMPEATRIIDLTQTEEQILAQMKPKGRYNIGVAEKNGVTVGDVEDIDAFYELLKATGGRDGFGILPKSHYAAFLKSLEGSFLLLAHNESKKPIAGLLGVIWNDMAVYYYGASNYAERALMAPYALQWAAILDCKSKGCKTYDLLGIAPPDSPVTHPWGGVSVFKEKFGGTVITYPSEQMITLSPWKWKVLQMKRKLWR